MKIVGLVTEYNPFHNGHKYHIEKAKEITQADAVVVVMSGNYVQRGTPAIMPKHLRTEAALASGVEAVFELPVCYASGSAEYFAKGAITFFEKLGCIDSICFGTECGDFEKINKIAGVVAEEPKEYQKRLLVYLKEGNSFPRARQMALKEYLHDDSLDMILEQPNNILGIEYMKALYLSGSRIKPYMIKRKEANYHDTELGENYSSASAIRRLLAYTSSNLHIDTDKEYDEPVLDDVLTRLEEQVPPVCIRLLEENHRERYPIYANDFSLLLKYKLLQEDNESLTKYLDVTSDIANRLINQRNYFISFEQFSDLIKTKYTTYTRVCRALLHILLDIKKEETEEFMQNGTVYYAHMLGFRKDSTNVLKVLKDNTEIPIISKLTATEEISETGEKMLQKDIYASDLYESVVTEKYKYPFINEYEQSIVMI